MPMPAAPKDKPEPTPQKSEKPTRGHSYHLGHELLVERTGDTVMIRWGEGKTMVLTLENWARAVTATTPPGISPEAQTVIAFMLTSKQEWIDVLASRVNDITGSYNGPSKA